MANQIQAFLSSDQRILFALSRPTRGRGDFELHIARIEFGRNSFYIFTFDNIFKWIRSWVMPHDDGKVPLLDRWDEKPYFLWMRSRPSFFGGLKIRFKWTSIDENILLNRPKIGTQSSRKYFSMPFPGLWSHFRFSSQGT